MYPEDYFFDESDRNRTIRSNPFFCTNTAEKLMNNYIHNIMLYVHNFYIGCVCVYAPILLSSSHKNRIVDFLRITYTMLHDANIPHRSCTSGECIHCDCIRQRRGRWQDWSRSMEELKYLCVIRHQICIQKSLYEEVDRVATSQSFSTCIHLRKNIFSIYFYLFNHILNAI